MRFRVVRYVTRRYEASVEAETLKEAENLAEELDEASDMDEDLEFYEAETVCDPCKEKE